MGKTLDELPDCNQKVYSKGEHIATIINLKPTKIEDIVKSAAKKSRQKIDWHYFGGRAIVKALGNIKRARDYLKQELENSNHRGYRFTTENDSVIPWPIK